VVETPKIKRIAVLGGGLIGSGWAVFFLWKGYPVHIYDISEEALMATQERTRRDLQYLSGKGVIPTHSVGAVLDRAEYTTSVERAVKDAQFIQEAAPEKYEVKQALLAQVDKHAEGEAIFASSTSGLLITEIARFSEYPGRCLGAHPYNPPHLIPLVEISKGDRTNEETVKRTYDFYKSLGKEPVVLQKEAPGYIANRLSVALYREAVDLVLRGVCTVEDIDRAVCFGPGLRFSLMGPNLIYHLGGGAQGIQGLIKHIGPSVERWWEDMAIWNKWPDGWPEIARDGVNNEMENRPPEQGNTVEQISKWRDDGLVELLKMIKKL